MKIQKFREYLILEGDTPENYMTDCLQRIKKKLDPLFNHDNSVKKIGDFSKFNLQMQNDAEPDKYSHVDRSLKYKFTDEDNTLYILTMTINLEDAVNDKPEEDYKTSDIKKIHVTFQKYGDKDGKFGILDQSMDRSVDPEEIDGDFLIKLKIDLDKGKTETEAEEFSIETEDDKEMPEEESNNEQTPNSQAPKSAQPSAQPSAQSGLTK